MGIISCTSSHRGGKPRACATGRKTRTSRGERHLVQTNGVRDYAAGEWLSVPRGETRPSKPSRRVGTSLATAATGFSHHEPDVR